jgi:hypothetical protein
MIGVRPLMCSLLALAACVPAAAQTLQPNRPDRPYRGVFGSGVDGSGQLITASATLSGGYDDNILADATNRNSIRNSQQGKLAQLSGGVNYGLRAGRGQFNAGAGSSLRYYPSLQNDYFKMYNASAAGRLQLMDKPGLAVRQSVNYQPFTFLAGLTTVGISPDIIEPLTPPEPDFVPVSTHYVNAQSGIDLDTRLSRRLSFNSSYVYRVARRSSRQTWRQSGATGFTVDLSRNLGLRLGYRYTEAHYTNRIFRSHRPDIGLDFRRALSLTRRTSFTFGVGAEATVVSEHTRYRAAGHVDVTHEIGRTWTASGGYQRGTYYIDTLDEPVFGDSASAAVSGLLTRRIQFQAVASAALGNAGFGVQRQYDSYRGSVSLSTALNRFTNIGVDYAYYKYVFDPSIPLDPGVPRDVNRQSIRAHVSFWAPLLNKTRRLNASR